MGLGGDGIGGDVRLDVVSVALEMETVMTDDLTGGEEVEDEEERTKH